MTENASYLPVAVRAHVELKNAEQKQTFKPEYYRPDMHITFDCETTPDHRQRLTFGFYRVYVNGRLIEEGIFIDPDALSDEERGTIEAFAAAHFQETDDGKTPLIIRVKDDFLKNVLFKVADKNGGAVVNFNQVFDLSRLACDARVARGRSKGGFSLVYRTYIDKKTGKRKNDSYFPRIIIKSKDAKGAFIRLSPSKPDRAPREHNRRGIFIDLKTLTWSLHNKAYTLEYACEAFGVEGKAVEKAVHGIITPDYIEYARQDVRATEALYQAAMREYQKHPIAKHPETVYSPAGIGRGYLDAMGVALPDLIVDASCGVSPQEVMGFAMASYYGGRAECRVRNHELPVAYCDFRSMYPTVNSLMGLWGVLTAESLTVTDDTENIQRFLNDVTLDDIFNPETWPRLLAIVEIQPGGDVLPARARYGGDGVNHSIGLNPLESPVSLYYTLADVVASKLLSGTTPVIARGFRFTPSEKKQRLRRVKLRGEVEIDPNTNDFFREVIRLRGAVKKDASRPDAERNALQNFLKILANSCSYGIYGEVNRTEIDRQAMTVYGRETFEIESDVFEKPGARYFPPIASLITGAARLMLTLAEASVRHAGGHYVMMDTDSITIVSTEHGGLIPCPGGDHRLPNGDEAVTALTWDEVDRIRERFERINPYRDGGVILKLEKENYGDDGKRRELLCFSTAAKRYALYTREAGLPVIQKASESALGTYYPPTGGDGKPVDGWIDQAWGAIIRHEVDGEPYNLPAWAGQPAKSRFSVSTPAMEAWVRRWNLSDPSNPESEMKPYSERVKPFNFLQRVSLNAFQAPPKTTPPGMKFNLVAPSGVDDWVNLHNPSGSTYRVTTKPLSYSEEEVLDERILAVKSYGERIIRHPQHVESKSLAPDGRPVRPSTRGLLRRRPVRCGVPRHIGKEANDLEKIENGLVDALEEVLTEYRKDISGDIARVFQEMDRRSVKYETGYSERQVRAIIKRENSPSSSRLPIALACAARFARVKLDEMGMAATGEDYDVVRLYAHLLREQDAIEEYRLEAARVERDRKRELYAAIRDITGKSGIAPGSSDTVSKFLESVPKSWQRVKGIPADVVAASLASSMPRLGIQTEDDLYQAFYDLA